MTFLKSVLDTLIFSAIAVFVVLKLKRILGNEYDDASVADKNQSKQAKVISNAIKVQTKSEKKVANDDVIKAEILEKNPKETEENIKTLIQIYKRNPLFSYASFLQGCEMLFEHVISCYSSQKMDEIKQVCLKDVADNFEKIIAQNTKDGNIERVHIAKINDIKIAKIEQKSGKFSVQIHIDSDQIQYTESIETKNITSGSNSRQQKISENWTLEKEIESENPNWIVSEILILES